MRYRISPLWGCEVHARENRRPRDQGPPTTPFFRAILCGLFLQEMGDIGILLESWSDWESKQRGSDKIRSWDFCILTSDGCRNASFPFLCCPSTPISFSLSSFLPLSIPPSPGLSSLPSCLPAFFLWNWPTVTLDELKELPEMLSVRPLYIHTLTLPCPQLLSLSRGTCWHVPALLRHSCHSSF